MNEKLMKLAKLARGKIKNVPFFLIEKDGKISCLLGTNHATSLLDLPKVCLEIMATCGHVIGEHISGETNKFEEAELFKTIFRPPHSENWYKKLKPEVQQFLCKAIAAYYNSYEEGVAKEIENFDLTIAYGFALQGIYSMIAEQSVTVEDQKEDSEEEQDAGLQSMDLGIASCFPDDRKHDMDNALEGMRRMLDQTNRKTLDDIQDLYTEFQEMQTKNTKLQVKNEENEQDEDLVLRYMQGTHLMSKTLAEEADQDEIVVKANQRWLPKIIKYHQTFPGSALFLSGVMHLLGGKGLLSLLIQAGFTIKKMGADGKFHDYVYPFAEKPVERTRPRCRL